jgi:hypothetical protein
VHKYGATADDWPQWRIHDRTRPRLCKNAGATCPSPKSTFQNGRYCIFAGSVMVNGPPKMPGPCVFTQPGPIADILWRVCQPMLKKGLFVKKVFSIIVLVLVASSAGAEAPERFSGTYRSLTARAPDEYSILELKYKNGMEYSVDFAVVAPNRTHHTGHIQGNALREGDVFTLTKQNIRPDGQMDNPATCILKMRIVGNVVRVVSEDGCAGYGGAATSFVEQGTNLVRVH